MAAPSSLTLDNNMIAYLEAFVHDNDKIVEFLREILDKARKRGNHTEADILGPLLDLEETGDVLRALWQIVSKRAGVVTNNIKVN